MASQITFVPPAFIAQSALQSSNYRIEGLAVILCFQIDKLDTTFGTVVWTGIITLFFGQYVRGSNGCLNRIIRTQ